MKTRKFTATIAPAALLAALVIGCSSGADDVTAGNAADVEAAASGDAATTTTALETTTTTEPGPQEGDQAGPDELTEAILEGSFVAERTITANNYLGEFAETVGMVDERRYTFSTDCSDDGSCTSTMINHTAEDAEAEFSLADGVATHEYVEPSECINDDGSEFANGLIEYRSKAVYTITAAEFREGRWIATAFAGESTGSFVVVDEVRWAIEGCDWGTTDGEPGTEAWTIEAKLLT